MFLLSIECSSKKW